jgi:hypothetical protein
MQDAFHWKWYYRSTEGRWAPSRSSLFVLFSMRVDCDLQRIFNRQHLFSHIMRFAAFIACFFCVSLGFKALSAEHWVFLDNKHVRLGVNMDAGASIGWFSHSHSNDNLLNRFDHGRYIQQSYYGDDDGSDWNGKPWCYNPVQGGSWKGEPSTLLESRIKEERLYVKTQPRQWASGEHVSEMYMEQWLSLDGGLARLKYRMTHMGATEHASKKHQEMPAVFVAPKLNTLVFCEASQPAWTNAALTRRQPGPPGSKDAIFETSERWAAWVNEKDEGLGIYFPHTDMVTSYRVTDTGIGNCSYLAPLQTWSLKPRMTVEYETVLAIGTIEQIRQVFSKIKSNEEAKNSK